MNCEQCGQPLAAGDLCCAQCGAVVTLPANGLPIPGPILSQAQDFGGRSWVLDEIGAWQKARAERVLLLTGEPGSGKSMLAAWLAGGGPPPDDEQAAAGWQRVAGGWSAGHFCVGADQAGSIDPIGFAKSLAAQLARRIPAFARGLVQGRDPGSTVTVEQRAGANLGTMIGVYIEAFVVNKSNPHDTFNRLIRDPLAELAKTCPGLAAWILVDALDEALAYPSPNIVTLLAGANDLPSGVRFLFTCRNDARVTDKFPGARRLNLSDPAYEQRNAEDVRRYVRRRLAEIGVPGDAETAIAEAAAGNFMYAHFILEEIASGRRSPSELDGLPPRLFDLYRSYLERLVPGTDEFTPRGPWPATYQPLLGSLSVAIPAAPLDRLSDWMGKKATQVPRLLEHVQPLTEYAAEASGYRLFHRSMNDFLATRELEGEGAPDLNPYYTPPAEQHARICRYYLDTYTGYWQDCDEYGLQRLGAHLRARLVPGLPPKDRRKAAEELYTLALDDGFRAAQFEKLGDAQASLDDVRLAVDVAVQLNQVSRVIELAGLYRQITRSASITKAIFDDVSEGNVRRAMQRASFFGIAPRPRGRWAEVLQLYLAWEAAVRGQADVVQELFRSAEELPSLWSSPLSDALRAHTARILAGSGRTGRTAEEWLAVLAPSDDPQQLLALYPVAVPPDAASRDERVLEMQRRLERYRTLVSDRPASEGTTSSFYALETDLNSFTGTLGDLLAELAADPACRQGIDEMLRLVVANTYPRYRDLGLVALGIVCLAVPDVDWVRTRLQQILAVALDRDAVLFAFDLPSILEAEATARRAGAGLPGLREVRDYIAQGVGSEDRWGSALRARSARAAALFWQGKEDQAFEQLREASRHQAGFAGFRTLSMLALANRCHELGDAARAAQPIWGRKQDTCLLDAARSSASHVRDEAFRQERLALVDAYGEWMAEATPNLVAVHNKLSTVPDPDVRRVYKDLVSARWASPQGRDEASLAGLIPIVLNDGTTLDALLGRWIGPRVSRLADSELADSIRLCATYLLD